MSELRLSQSPVVSTDEDRRALRDSVGRLVSKYGRSYFQKVGQGGAFHRGAVARPRRGRLPRRAPARGVRRRRGGLADLAVVIEECAAHGCPMQYIVISSIYRADPRPPRVAGAQGPLAGRPGRRHQEDRRSRSPSPTPAPTRTGSRHARRRSKAAAGGSTARSTGPRAPTRRTRCWSSARDAEPGPTGKPTLSLFVVDTTAPGITMQVIDSALGAPERQFMLFFDDVPVAADSHHRRRRARASSRSSPG